MVFKVFSVYDSKADAFMPPVFMHATGQMVRAFSDAVNEEGTAFNKHPGDYRLALIGEFDDSSGRLSSYEKVEWIGSGDSYYRPKE